MFDIWNENEPLVRQQYEKDNFLIRDYDKDDAKPYCVIYFSSNGLYYPNTEESFCNFVKSDRYEWKTHHFHNVRREIYVRDIVKQWYITGINSRLSSIDKMVEWLSDNIPAGCDVITVGNSAGGYIAVLAACLLNARYAYDFSGQFSIEDALEDKDASHNALFKRQVERYRKNGGKLYLNIAEYIKTAPDLDIFYFYPALCDEDKRQSALVSDMENVHAFAFRDDKHGQTMYNFNLEDVFEMEPERLVALSSKFGRKVISRMEFSVCVKGITGTVREIIRKIYKKRFANGDR